MKRTLLTAAFVGLITVIGNAQIKKEKAPPPIPVAVTLEEVPPPLPPPTPLPPSINKKHKLHLQEDNVYVPPAPPVPESPKAIKKKH